MRTKNFTEEQINDIIKLYTEDKLSTLKIGDQFNIGKKAINNLLRKNNVEIRTTAESIYKGGKIESNKRYREKEGQSEKQKKYMETYYPKYREENSEVLKEKSIKHYYDNHEKYLEQQKNYRNKNLDKIKQYRETYKIIRNEKHKERIKSDPLYKITCNVRGLIKQGFNKSRYNKKSKTQDILGCSFDEFKQHLESKWEPWMNWENSGNPSDGIFEPNKTWDIDHIIPISTAKTEEDIIRLNHYTNLQPLCSYINRFIKRDII